MYHKVRRLKILHFIDPKEKKYRQDVINSYMKNCIKLQEVCLSGCPYFDNKEHPVFTTPTGM